MSKKKKADNQGENRKVVNPVDCITVGLEYKRAGQETMELVLNMDRGLFSWLMEVILDVRETRTLMKRCDRLLRTLERTKGRAGMGEQAGILRNVLRSEKQRYERLLEQRACEGRAFIKMILVASSDYTMEEIPQELVEMVFDQFMR